MFKNIVFFFFFFFYTNLCLIKKNILFKKEFIKLIN